ncbi:universal stress protein [Hansschlegelia zhihuaiae]|uniref:Universal stress protein n=1 Tax=Hansschlegelia zhihuaiae TaxID=405005 RepID=A0A4Q0MII8_9HYPH|nr:universal stress protein [Hansschlegelia zhihuaiae]RXF73195.1 universal stress protein [Hansschlegelia zhihuaiae]
MSTSTSIEGQISLKGAQATGSLGNKLYSRILVPIDGSPLSGEAISHAVGLAHATGATIYFVTVTEPYEPTSSYAVTVYRSFEEHSRQMKKHVQSVMSPAAAVATAAEVPTKQLHLEDAEPFRAIIRAAEDNDCQLIVMASHGRRGISALVMGSQTVKVLTHSSIPVLVCRAK